MASDSAAREPDWWLQRGGKRRQGWGFGLCGSRCAHARGLRVSAVRLEGPARRLRHPAGRHTRFYVEVTRARRRARPAHAHRRSGRRRHGAPGGRRVLPPRRAAAAPALTKRSWFDDADPRTVPPPTAARQRPPRPPGPTSRARMLRPRRAPRGRRGPGRPTDRWSWHRGDRDEWPAPERPERPGAARLRTRDHPAAVARPGGDARHPLPRPCEPDGQGAHLPGTAAGCRRSRRR